MYSGKLVFSQVMAHLPMRVFDRCVRHYDGHRYVKSFSCTQQFFSMAFAQLTHRESLRDLEVCLRAQGRKLYHMGFRGPVARATLAHANQKRDWRLYAEFAQELIHLARPLYADEDLGLELDSPVFALDSSTIDLCLSVFPWALFRKTKSAIKLHTLLDLQGRIPAFIHVTHGKVGDVRILDLLLPEAGAFYVWIAPISTSGACAHSTGPTASSSFAQRRTPAFDGAIPDRSTRGRACSAIRPSS